MVAQTLSDGCRMWHQTAVKHGQLWHWKSLLSHSWSTNCLRSAPGETISWFLIFYSTSFGEVVLESGVCLCVCVD